jgi:hypothetical protein
MRPILPLEMPMIERQFEKNINHDALDALLLDGLPSSLRESIDRALRLGASHADILLRAKAAGDEITVAAVEAYLRTKE